MNVVSKSTGRLATAAVFLLALFSASCAENKQTQTAVKVGGGSVAGVYDELARTLASIINANQADGGIQLETVTSAGSVANIDALAAGEIQFGVAQADDQYSAVYGLDEWAEKGPQKDLRSVAGIYYELVTLVAGGDTDIQSFSDLKGKRVGLGLASSGTRQNAIHVLEAAGIDWQKDIQVVELNLDDQMAAFTKNELDAFFFTAGHPNKEVKFATYSLRGARLIDLENIEDLVVKHPYYAIQSIPLGRYPRALNEESTRTVGVRATLVTSAKVPDEVVYQLTKTAYENSEKFSQYFPEFAEMRDGKIFEGLTAPLHPGAVKYFQEAGIEVPAEALN